MIHHLARPSSSFGNENPAVFGRSHNVLLDLPHLCKPGTVALPSRRSLQLRKQAPHYKRGVGKINDVVHDGLCSGTVKRVVHSLL